MGSNRSTLGSQGTHLPEGVPVGALGPQKLLRGLVPQRLPVGRAASRVPLGQPPAPPPATPVTLTTPVLGRMRVLLTLHGGENALSEVMSGLVARNARAIREGKLPITPDKSHKYLTYTREPIWYDGPSAMLLGRCTAGTLAAWEAASLIVDGKSPDVTVGYVEGVPVVVSGVGGVMVSDPSVRFGRRDGDRPGAVGAIPGDSDEGRVTEAIYLTIDEPMGLPVREIGDKIAEHNAKRILKHGLPDVYSSGVHYQTEGTPEKWWDVEEILQAGYDDCEGLSAYVAGWHIAQGRKAGVWTRLVEAPASGSTAAMGGSKRNRLFHAVARVQGPDGTWFYDDPSATLGMPVPSWYMQQAKAARAAGRPL